jgi:hypothetical protein
MEISELRWNLFVNRHGRLTLDLSFGHATASVEMSMNESRDLAATLSGRGSDWRRNCWRVEQSTRTDQTTLTLYQSERGFVRVTTIELTVDESRRMAHDLAWRIAQSEAVSTNLPELVPTTARHRLIRFLMPGRTSIP